MGYVRRVTPHLSSDNHHKPISIRCSSSGAVLTIRRRRIFRRGGYCQTQHTAGSLHRLLEFHGEETLKGFAFTKIWYCIQRHGGGGLGRWGRRSGLTRLSHLFEQIPSPAQVLLRHELFRFRRNLQNNRRNKQTGTGDGFSKRFQTLVISGGGM